MEVVGKRGGSWNGIIVGRALLCASAGYSWGPVSIGVLNNSLNKPACSIDTVKGLCTKIPASSNPVSAIIRKITDSEPSQQSL